MQKRCSGWVLVVSCRVNPVNCQETILLLYVSCERMIPQVPGALRGSLRINDVSK